MLAVLELVIELFIILGFGTQVILPLVFGRPLFPSLRWSKQRHELEATLEAIARQDLEDEIEVLKLQLKTHEGSKTEHTKETTDDTV